MNKLSFLLTTVGRPTLINMLNSLKSQLDENDTIYIAIDGQKYWQEVDKQLSLFSGFKCSLKPIYEKENLGFWGHALRNKYQHNLDGDYILHCDDDDIYLKNSIINIKKKQLDKEYIYLYKLSLKKRNSIIWKRPKLHRGNIGTPSGVIPNIPTKFGTWGTIYGGDHMFYESCDFKFEYVDEIIYQIRPTPEQIRINLE